MIRLAASGSEVTCTTVWRYINSIINNIITLRAKLSGAVYCYRSCLWRRVFVSVFVCLFVDLLT